MSDTADAHADELGHLLQAFYDEDERELHIAIINSSIGRSRESSFPRIRRFPTIGRCSPSSASGRHSWRMPRGLRPTII